MWDSRPRLSDAYFLNKFSNAARASFGFRLAGVDVSFSRVTRISNSSQELRSSFFAIRSFTGCMHSKRLPGSKYVHCLQECSSNPHFAHFPSVGIPCSTVPHCAQRDTARVPGRFTGRGPSAWSQRGGPLLRSSGGFRGACCDRGSDPCDHYPDNPVDGISPQMPPPSTWPIVHPEATGGQVPGSVGHSTRGLHRGSLFEVQFIRENS